VVKTEVAVLAFIMAGISRAPAQAPGDSIRVRALSAVAWTEGRFVSLDSSRRLTIGYVDSPRTYSLDSLERVEVLRRTSVIHAALPWILISEGVVILAAVTSPEEKSGTYLGAAALAAGGGLIIGAIEVKQKPWRWKRVHFGPRAAT